MDKGLARKVLHHGFESKRVSSATKLKDALNSLEWQTRSDPPVEKVSKPLSGSIDSARDLTGYSGIVVPLVGGDNLNLAGRLTRAFAPISI